MSKKDLILSLCILLLILKNACGSQFHSSPVVPINDPVYSYLEQCWIKGLTATDWGSYQPRTCLEIADELGRLISQTQPGSGRIFKTDLLYYLDRFRPYGQQLDLPPEWSQENERLKSRIHFPGLSFLKPRWHAFSKIETRSKIFLDPLFGARWDANSDQTIRRTYSGLQIFGNFSDLIAYSFRFVDHVERGLGSYTSRAELLEDHYGYVGPLLGGDETYYDLTEAYLGLSWSRLNLYFGKDRVAWGPGEEKLLLSGNSPSINHLRFDFRFLKAIKFYYLIGNLNPINANQDTLYTSAEGWTRIIPTDKWLVAHRVEISITPELRIGLSEALIWGDRGLELAYLNPINFLFSAEHDGGDTDNVLLQGDFTWRFVQTGLFYGSLLIDDLKSSTLGQGDPGNKFGFTAGLKLPQLGLDGLETNCEYARLDPYVYSHFYQVNRYTTWTSSLGSSLKPNSDRFRCRLRYRPFRWVGLNLHVDWNRHGTVGGEIQQAVPRQEPPKAHFLAGDQTTWREIGFRLDWELYPALLLEAGYLSGNQFSMMSERYFFSVSYRKQ